MSQILECLRHILTPNSAKLRHLPDLRQKRVCYQSNLPPQTAICLPPWGSWGTLSRTGGPPTMLRFRDSPQGILNKDAIVGDTFHCPYMATTQEDIGGPLSWIKSLLGLLSLRRWVSFWFLDVATVLNAFLRTKSIVCFASKL